MKLLVAVPSKGRPDAIYKNTLRWVVRTGFDVRIFVEPQELEAYREAARLANYEYRLDIFDEQFVDIGATDKGLGFVKQFIHDYAIEHKYDLVFKMDDDVKRFKGRGKSKPDDLMVLDFAEMVGECRLAFGKYPDVAAIGFPYDNELFEGKYKTWRSVNERLQSCYIIRSEYINGGYDTFEDFAQFIYIRQQGKITLRYGALGIDCADVGKNGGGVPNVR